MSIYKDKTLLLIGGSSLVTEEVIRHFLKEGVQQLRIFSGDEEGMVQLREQLSNKSITDAARVKYFIGDVEDPAYLEETMHGVDYVLYAPTMKSSIECEEQPADACSAILNPVNNVMRTAGKPPIPRIAML